MCSGRTRPSTAAVTLNGFWRRGSPRVHRPAEPAVGTLHTQSGSGDVRKTPLPYPTRSSRPHSLTTITRTGPAPAPQHLSQADPRPVEYGGFEYRRFTGKVLRFHLMNQPELCLSAPAPVGANA